MDYGRRYPRSAHQSRSAGVDGALAQALEFLKNLMVQGATLVVPFIVFDS
jgi:hypothetical protein